MTFIHRDRVCAKHCTPDGAQGCYDVIEDDGIFRVVDGDAVSERCESLEEAVEVAQNYADSYDRECAPRRYRIRHCEGNKAAWCLIALRDDGSEINSYGGWRTSMSLDAFFKYPQHPTPKPGDIVELVL